jgi:voltage-gated sodium channel
MGGVMAHHTRKPDGLVHRLPPPNALARVMDSRPVHTIVGLLVIINAIVLGMLTYYSANDPLYKTLTLIDHTILGIFMIEILLRLVGHGFNYFRSGWNIFDFLIIFGTLIPYADSASVLRSLRVLRLFYFVEISQRMRHILRGLALAFSGVFHVILLMMIMFYAYAVMGVSLFQHPEVAQFQNLTAAFHTLFQVLTGDDWYNVMRGVLPKFPKAWIYFYSYYLVMSFVVLNFFIGIIVGAMQSAAEEVDIKHDDDDNTPNSDNMQKSMKMLLTEMTALKQEINVMKSKMGDKKE